jgi:hypothetical protein
MRNPFKRTVPMKLWRYVNKRNRRPTLPGGLSTDYDKSKLQVDEKIVMMMAGARDQEQARKAMEGFETALDWIKAQPRKSSRRGARLMGWIRRVLGVYEFDPLQSEEPMPSKRLRVRYLSEKDLQ